MNEILCARYAPHNWLDLQPDPPLKYVIHGPPIPMNSDTKMLPGASFKKLSTTYFKRG